MVSLLKVLLLFELEEMILQLVIDYEKYLNKRPNSISKVFLEKKESIQTHDEIKTNAVTSKIIRKKE